MVSSVRAVVCGLNLLSLTHYRRVNDVQRSSVLYFDKFGFKPSNSTHNFKLQINHSPTLIRHFTSVYISVSIVTQIIK